MSKHGNPQHGPHHNGSDQSEAPARRGVHHSWIFWVGVVLTLAAIMVYVMSFDLAWRPRARTTQPVPLDAVGK